MAINAAYKQKMQPYANKAAIALNMPVDVILAQWAIESGNGTNSHSSKYNNHASIKYTINSKTAYKRTDSAFAGYRSIDDFVTDYVRVMKLSYYDAVRSATTVEGTVKALAASPFDEGHYGGNGANLLSMLGLNTSGSTEKKTAVKSVCPTCKRAL
jgi:flagellum-specific peptidoglycan hydrolase FlgJ